MIERKCGAASQAFPASAGRRGTCHGYRWALKRLPPFSSRVLWCAAPGGRVRPSIHTAPAPQLCSMHRSRFWKSRRFWRPAQRRLWNTPRLPFGRRRGARIFSSRLFGAMVRTAHIRRSAKFSPRRHSTSMSATMFTGMSVEPIVCIE